MNYYEKWDTLSKERWQFRDDMLKKYVGELENAHDRCIRKVISTFGRGLGIASPSKFTKYMIGKHSPGRIIKTIKPHTPYQICYYDKNNLPVYMESYDFPSQDDPNVMKRTGITYFISYDNDIWTAYFNAYKKDKINVESMLSGNYKIVRDERGSLRGLYYICGHDTAIIYAEEYDYSEYDNGIINCTFSYYVEGRSGASKDIPTGFKNSPLEQWKYIFYVNEKGKFICFDSYKNKNGEFVLIKKNAKK